MARRRWSLKISARSPIEALLCLLAALMGPAQLLPDLLALGAALENSHTVHVGSDGSGLHLVLSHERGQPGRPDYTPRHHPLDTRHRHGLAAGLLCVLAANDVGEPEHSAFFASGSILELSRNAQATNTPAADSNAWPSCPPPSGTAIVLHPVTETSPPHDYDPPGTTRQASLQSIVLLI